MTTYDCFYVFIIFLKLICCQACSSSQYPCILNGTHGNISSPNYPSNYPHHANISWLIQVPHAYTVKLTFKDFVLENSLYCHYDHLTIYDGASTTGSPIIGKYCGHSKPPDHFSSGMQMLVVFISDRLDGDIGFMSSYEAVKEVSSCSSNNSNAENKNILLKQSPGSLFTDFSNNITDIQCIWKLRAPKGYGIRMTVSSMGFLENITCEENSVELYGGYFIQKNSLIQRFCGDNSVIFNAIVKYNPHRTAIIQLKVSQISLWTAQSFVASYEFIEKDTKRCSPLNNFDENNNIQLSGDHGNFTFNNSDRTKVKCRWRISAPDGYQIKLKFLEFRLDNDCQKSYIQIFDGENRDRGKFCGPQSPWVVFSTGGFLFVKLVVVGLSNKVSWFTAMYEAVTKALGRCSTINSRNMNSNIGLEDSSGTIITPNYPSPYPPNFICIWVITAPIHYRVRLHFKVFQIESYACKYDYIQIRDGGTGKSPVIRDRLCGDSSVPQDVYSSSNQLWILFNSDHSEHMKGFLASYNAILPEPSKCSLVNTVDENNNIELNDSSGFLTSPNYPHPYPPNIKCTWHITVPKLSRIIIHFLDFKLDPRCLQGYLWLYDGDCLCNSLGKQCASDTPFSVVSSGNSLKLIFQAGTASIFRGFNLSYHVPLLGPGICSIANSQNINDNLYLNKTSGQVTSPQYPFPYTPGTQCTWYARAPRGFHVQLSIKEMDLPIPCMYDYLEVHDGDSPRSPITGKLCDGENPKRLYSSGQNMVFKFVSRQSVSRKSKGFVADYRMILAGNCSKDFDESWNTNLKLGEKFGILTSPGYPQLYPPDIRCTWKITVPYGYRVKLKISGVSLGRPCSTDFVEVKDGLHPSSKRLGRFCKTVIGREITSSGRYLLVHFESGNSSSLGKGFEASYTEVSDGTPKSESAYAKVLIICLVAFACFALVTVSSLCLYWLFKKRCCHRRHSDPPLPDLTALSPLPPRRLDDIPDCLIAEDRPPSYAEATTNEEEELNAEPPGHQAESPDQATDSQQLRSIERGLDNPAFTNDPPSYESLYGVDPT